MDSPSTRETRVLWAFWIACGLAATGGIAPLLLAAGGTNRIAGAVIPFGVAAVAMAVNALMYHQGRPFATALYFVAGIALVYGMLAMVAVPLRLAVLGTCTPTATFACAPGAERALTSGESTGLAVAIAMGTISIFVGFFGLLMLYRLPPRLSIPPPTRRVSEPPPVRRDTTTAVAVTTPPPPPAPEAPSPAVASEPALSAPPPAAPASRPKATRKPRAKRAPKPSAELPPPEEPLELPAPEEPLELPAPSSPDEPPSRTGSAS
jgi:hypothetical protein